MRNQTTAAAARRSVRVMLAVLTLAATAGCVVDYPDEAPEPRRPTAAPGERRIVAPKDVVGFTKVGGVKPPRVDFGDGVGKTVNAYYRRPGISADDRAEFNRVVAAEVEGGEAQAEKVRKRLMREVVGGDALIAETGRDAPGPLGGVSYCGFLGAPEDNDVVCAWSDADTAGVITLDGAANTEPGLARLLPMFVAMRHDLVR
ncbi:hypothetical protein [Actinocorallia sp. A-T 12471]|uniref:hypothetical protein n=1 Tax=Actinocorallia sp. A-T 12471 TaxID=3089813 RepID=UPI0029D36571|nr:hypothetical protein [Actinocorallia sp. A-T 12471]MDX6743329.1 hypothetical protein [Actinocorallia sp. A-T 12471]